MSQSRVFATAGAFNKGIAETFPPKSGCLLVQPIACDKGIQTMSLQWLPL